LLAKGSDEYLARIAKNDVGTPPETLDGKLELADAWYEFSQSAPENRGFGERARYWYTRCRAEATGLAKAKIEKRLSELSPATASTSGTTTIREAAKVDISSFRTLADVQVTSGGDFAPFQTDQPVHSDDNRFFPLG
jgi:hypothetical protein